jgi:hypothetical protein
VDRNANPNRVPTASRWWPALLCALFLALPAAAQEIAEAIPSPDGDTSFVGKVMVSFPQLLSVTSGKIYYTLNGGTPTQDSGIEYQPLSQFAITATTTLRSVRYRGMTRSPVHTAQFTRRRLPAPAIAFDDKPEFVGTKRVTLSVNVNVPAGAPNAGTAPRIMYSTDASNPDSLYSGPLTLAKSCRLKAWTVHADYETSPMATQDFQLLIPVDKPVLTPRGQIFQNKTQLVSFTSGTGGVYFQYALGANANPDTGAIASSVLLEGRTPGEIITLHVVAKKSGMAPSRTTEVYTYQPRPAMPSANPPSTFFQDTLTIALAGQPDIHYTLDNSAPTTNKPKYDKPFRIDSTLTLKAAVINAQGASDTYVATYTLNLSAPMASRPSGEFLDTAQVILKARNPGARILYELDGAPPTLSSPAYNPAEGPIVLSRNTELRTMAVKGSVTSPILSYTYTKADTIRTTPTPVVDPPGRIFQDSLFVRVTGSPNAALYVGRNGGPLLKYEEPVRLDATTTLQFQATSAFLNPSPIRTEKYLLIPAMPVASPDPAEPYAGHVAVTLSTKTLGASLFCYIHDEDQTFNRTLASPCPATLHFEQSKWLWVVAETGTGDLKQSSPVLKVRYTVYSGNPSDTLASGKQKELAPDILLINRGPGPITAKLGSFDLLDLRGFSQASHSVTLSSGAGQPAPRVDITRPEGKQQAVYRIVNDRPEFVGSGTVVTVTGAGVYFAAVDTVPPVLLLASQTAKPGEGTAIKLRVVDNVAGVSCDVEGSGLGAAPLHLRADADGFLGFTVKGATGEWRPLWFRANAFDGANPGAFPTGGGRYHPPQAWSKLVTPAVWSLGGEPRPYDMAGFPIGAGSRVTWGQLKKDNPELGLAAYVYRDGDHVALKDAETLEPGVGLWLGSTTEQASLSLSKFETAPSDSDGRYRVALRPGWNLISNPSLDKLYWPAARTRADAYEAGFLKGLWGYPPGLKQYVESDSLEPWEGYWVHLWGEKDTVVELLGAPVPAAKRAASWDPSAVEIRLDYGRPSPLRLGARTYARDGLWMEDEPLLPGWNRARQAWSARDRSRLMTDLLRFAPDQVLEWQVVVDGRSGNESDSAVTVTECRLPPGFQAWAYSARRNLKVSLEAGTGYSLSGEGADTLLILAGPAAKLAARKDLAQAVTGVTAFASGLRRGPQGLHLYLALPENARVRAEIRSLSGRLLHTLPAGRLGMGEHRLPLPEPHALAGMGYLRVQVFGQTWRKTRVHPLR